MYRLDWWFVIVLVLVAIFPIGMGVTGGIRGIQMPPTCTAN